MVKFTASIVALAMAAAVTAAPAPSSETTFSFASWVEDIIANPDTALSPEQAVAAANSASVVSSAGGLTKRAWCPAEMKDAPSGDAAACLNDLARKGSAGTNCVVGQSAIQMCRIGGAELVGTKAEAGTYTVNCNDIARTGGLIFDTCYRADNTVKGSELCITNSNIQVNIQGV
ncbi:unnamed protein product [Colletotrichum noveboracense]|uniref:Cyanovirin-N domain-containing protein n=1 Tax=Colletotrichum noveboracense TaxID=2664923 RepID=A0A9W4WM04_9PEZI|nr:hypothetical protein CBS470a_012000 [Colletotrichum nupharicola]KAJ0275117.1 hypothetical protein COL940_008948 [Colletotrichum noveboracense]CAI0649936.1 unnamed protein product [Colletotrichum noveboracense]